MNAGAIRVHDLQYERRFVAVLVLRRELRFALIEQDALRLRLARGGEHDAAVGQIVGRDVVDRGRIRVAGGVDDCVQGVARDHVLVDAPRRRHLGILVHGERAAHGEHHPGAVGGGVDVLHVPAGAGGEARRDVGLRRTRRGGGALVEIRGRQRIAQHPQVVLQHGAAAVHRHGALHIEDGKVDRGRIAYLAVGDVDATAAAAGGERSRERRRQQRRGEPRQGERTPCASPRVMSAALRVHVRLPGYADFPPPVNVT